MIDMISYEIGKKKGVKDATGVVVLEDGQGYTFTDASGDGNIVIAEKEEVVTNG